MLKQNSEEDAARLYNHAADIADLQETPGANPLKIDQQTISASAGSGSQKAASTGDSPVDPLKIHNRMQQEAVMAKKMKQQLIVKKRVAKLLAKQQKQRHKTLVVSPGTKSLSLIQQRRTAYFPDGERKIQKLLASSHTIKTGLVPQEPEDKENLTPAYLNQQENRQAGIRPYVAKPSDVVSAFQAQALQTHTQVAGFMTPDRRKKPADVTDVART